MESGRGGAAGEGDIKRNGGQIGLLFITDGQLQGPIKGGKTLLHAMNLTHMLTVWRYMIEGNKAVG